jgi:Secretion system C-terminal sorting domain
LFPAYPNPFNSATTIEYSIKQDGLVSLKVYDVLGAEVISLVNANQVAGKYSVQFDASSLTSGNYIYRLISGQFTSSKKLILLK